MTDVQAPRKIYVIECGEYSDYHVVCAFESEQDARQLSYGDGYREMVLYPPGVEPVVTHEGWTVLTRVYSDGRVQDEMPPQRSVQYDWEVDTSPNLMPERPELVVEDRRSNSYWDCWRITAVGRDLDDVKKAVSDRVAHLRAEALDL